MKLPSKPIREFMTPMPTMMSMETPLVEARKLMDEHGIRHLPILDGEKLVGVVSRRELDMLMASLTFNAKLLSIADAMTDLPFSVPPDTALSVVCDEMAANKYGCAVVMEAGKVEGIFTTTDALQVLADIVRGIPER